jgi:hypothetical protein
VALDARRCNFAQALGLSFEYRQSFAVSISGMAESSHGAGAVLRLRLVEFGRSRTREAVQAFAAEALEILRDGGSREANRYLFGKIGTRVAADHDAGYFAEALYYHLGLINGYAGEPDKMADYISLSKTMPGLEGERLFSDHVADSWAVRERRQDPIERGIPAILFACLPRSGSATVAYTLARLCDLPVTHISVANYVAPSWLDMFLEGGAVNQDHIAANDFNLGVLIDRGPRDVFVTIRDPRAAACSAVLHRVTGTLPPYSPEELEKAIEEECLSRTIPWLEAWIKVARAPDTPLRIHWVPYRQTAADAPATVRRVCEILAERDATMEPFTAIQDIKEVRLNFAVGNDEERLARLSEASGRRLWEACSVELRELIDANPSWPRQPVALSPRRKAKREKQLRLLCVGTGRDGTQSLAHMIGTLYKGASDREVMHEYCCREFYQSFSEYREGGGDPSRLAELKRMVADCGYDAIVGNGYASVLPLFAEHYGRGLILVHLQRRDREACIASLKQNCASFPTAYRYYSTSPAAVTKRMAAFHFDEMSIAQWDGLSPDMKFGWYYDKTHALIAEHSGLFDHYVEIATEDLNDDATRQMLAELCESHELPPATHLNASAIDIALFPEEHRHRLHWLMGRLNLEEVAADDVYAMNYFVNKFVAWSGYQIRHDQALERGVPPSAGVIEANLERALKSLRPGIRDIEGLRALLAESEIEPGERAIDLGSRRITD